MPELPELETVRIGLEQHLVGHQIARTRLPRPDILVRGGLPRSQAMLAHAEVVGISRHGKQLAIEAKDGRRLVIQLGMSGRVGVGRPASRGPESKHVHAVWTLSNNEQFWFQDPRRFGGLKALRSPEALVELWGHLGPDALLATPQRLRACLVVGHRGVKAVLLDQHRIAGVGNIYADESLHRAGIHPERPVGALSDAERGLLVSTLRSILRQAIRVGGTTFSDHRMLDGRSGGWSRNRRVHGRGGRACLACEMLLSKSVIAGRTTVWCSGCQR